MTLAMKQDHSKSNFEEFGIFEVLRSDCTGHTNDVT